MGCRCHELSLCGVQRSSPLAKKALLTLLLTCGAALSWVFSKTSSNDGYSSWNYPWTTKQTDPSHNNHTASKRQGLHVAFHVGPAKMGSTTIQMGAIKALEAEWKQDGYRIHDFRQSSKLNQCLARNVTLCLMKKRQHQPSPWKDFVDFLARASNSHSNVLISTENYWNHLHPNQNNDDMMKAYQDVFARYGYHHVTIILGYRPLFEYWPSFYYQTYAHYCGYAKEIVENRQIPSLLDFLQEANASVGLHHPTLEARHHFLHYFDEVRIVSLGPDLSSQFACRAVGFTAPRACAAAKLAESNLKQHVWNQGHSLVYDRIAQAARYQGLSKLPCRTLANQLMQKMNQSVLPLACLDKSQQQWLWNQTFSNHQACLLNTTLGDEKLLRSKFTRATQSTLCSVDVETVLSNWTRIWNGTT